MRQSKELQIGKAGEYLVCADLIMKGFVAFPSEQGLPYDVLLDNGIKLLRVQVKTTSELRAIPQRKKTAEAYIFTIKRHGKKNIKKYGNDEVDLFALVCLDTKQCGYVLAKDMPVTANFRADKNKGDHRDEKGIKDYYMVKELNKTIKSQTEISKMTGLAVATINRMLKKGFEPYKTNARYFSDILRDAEWFDGL